MLRILSSVRSTVAPSRFFSSSSLAASKSLFVGNWSYNATTSDLEELFGAYGQVEEFKVPTHHDGKPRGFAFVTFAEDANADTAIAELNGTMVHDRPIRVSVSTPHAQGSAPRRFNNPDYMGNRREPSVRERQGYGGERQRYGSERREYSQNDDDFSKNF